MVPFLLQYIDDFMVALLAIPVWRDYICPDRMSMETGKTTRARIFYNHLGTARLRKTNDASYVLTMDSGVTRPNFTYDH